MPMASSLPPTAEADDTIVAVSSPAGSSARTIVRLSGPQAMSAAAEIFRTDSGGPVQPRSRACPTYTSVVGRIAVPRESLQAPAILYVMKAPWSYTREDVVEIHTIGSPPLIEMLLDAILSHGARLAAPGEFTRRAFLHGRIDLAQAESVMAVIRSRSDAELRSSVACLRGKWSQDLAGGRDALADLCSHVELMIDFSDQDVVPFTPEQLRKELDGAIAQLKSISAGAEEGRIRTDAVATAIYGRPNVGKSSLMNALGVTRRAIVSPTPGTTRDTVENLLDIEGVRFRFIDTAGLRDAADDLEGLAAARAREAARRADLGLLVLDGSLALTSADKQIADELSPPAVVAVVNKCDMPQNLSLAEVSRLPNVEQTIITSALTGAGIAELKQAMVNLVVGGRIDRSASVSLANARHRGAIRRALAALGRAEHLLSPGREIEPELVAFELRDALSILGEIAGEVTPDDLLDRIFSQFCIGK